jgi:hypothetical protein
MNNIFLDGRASIEVHELRRYSINGMMNGSFPENPILEIFVLDFVILDFVSFVMMAFLF